MSESVLRQANQAMSALLRHQLGYQIAVIVAILREAGVEVKG